MSPASEHLTLLDACAVINLYATGHIDEIISCIGGRVGIVTVVMQESLFVAGQTESEDREMIDLSPLVTTGSLKVLSPATDGELYSFLDFAIDLNDEEAMTLAIALHRNAAVVTDDRKAIRVATDAIETVASLEAVKRWFTVHEVGAEQQGEMLLAIQNRASYVPGRNHPYRAWWDNILGQQ